MMNRQRLRQKYWLALSLALLPSLLWSVPIIREIPSSYDHATHLFKAWHFWEELVPTGRVRGWSHYWGFGFPSDELVPPGGEVWVGVFRFLTLGLLPWDRTYAVALAGLMVFQSFAVFRFVRLYFGTVAGVLCAWLSFLDPGGLLEGGWEWHTHYGVWPVTLCASIALLSLERLEWVIRRGRARDVLIAGVLFGLALTTHQLALVAFAILTPLLLLDRGLRHPPLEWARCAQVLGALMIGFCVAAFYLVPFLARTDQTLDLGWMHEPLSEIGTRFLELRTFQRMWPPLHVLGVVGGAIALWKRVRGGVFFVSASVVLIMLASDVLVSGLHLERALPTLIKVEVNRLLLLAKLFWFPLAAFGLVRLARVPARLARRSGRSVWLAQVLAFALPLSLVVVNWRGIYSTQIAREVVGQQEMKYWQDFQEFISWSKNEREKNNDHYRIAYRMRRTDHSSTALPVYNGTPMYKVGYTPTQIFVNLPWLLTPQTMTAANVKFVLSTIALNSRSLRLMRQFGQLYLYSFLDYSPDPFTLSGSGHAELLEFGPEVLRIRIAGTDATSRLKLHVANYPRWEASIAGVPVPLKPATVGGVEDPMLMAAPARDGEFVLRYVYRVSDWLGLLLTMSVLPVFFGLWLLERRFQLLTKGCSWLSNRRLPLLGTGAVVLVALVVAVAMRTRTRERLLSADSIFQRVSSGDMTLASVPCERQEPLVFSCGEQRVEAQPVVDAVWGVHLCMHSESPGPLEVQLRTKVASHLGGSYAAATKGPGTIEAWLDGTSLGKIRTRHPFLRRQHLQYNTRSHSGQESTLRLSLSGTALNCFDFRILD